MRNFYNSVVFLFTLLIFSFGASSNQLLLNTASQALLTVIPNDYSSTAGGSTFLGPLANGGRTYQFLIHSDQLTNLQNGHQITSISLRIPISATGNWPASDVTFTNYDIYLSKSVTPADRSLTFANNIVGTQTQVRTGSLTVLANSYTFGNNPNNFGPEITFNTPYIYSGGHLLIEIRHTGFTGTSSSIDAIGTAVTGYGTQFSACATTSYTGITGSQANFSIARLNSDPLSGPNIFYSELQNTANTGNRQLTATVSSPSGVVLGPNGPRLYYKKSTDGSYIFDNNPSVSGNDFTFTINTASLGGVSAGTIIQYYVAAQDITGEARTNPFGGSGINPPGTTPPGSPNQYAIVNSYSGQYTVGASGFFPSISAAITALSAGEVTGAVFLNLIDASYTGESFPIVLTEVIGMNASNTVNIRPATGMSCLIHNSAGNGLFTFNGGDYFNIIGNNPTGEGLESLTLRNGGSTATASGLLFQNDATFNIIDGCIIESDMTLTTLGAIHFGTSASGSTGNDNNTITNCEIRHISTSANAYSNGIYSSGTTANSNSDNIISNNKIYNFTNSGVSVSATGNGNNWTISGNNFYNNYSTAPVATQTSINFIPGTNSNNNIISSNNIGGSDINCGGSPWINTGNVTFGCITTNVGITGATKIYSNTIKNIYLQGTTSPYTGISCVTNGLVEVGVDGANNIGGPAASEQIRNSGNSTCIAINSSVGSAGGVTISNNIIQNLYSSGTGTGIGNRGISHTGAGNLLVSNNTISNNKSDASTSADATSSVLGIYTSSTNTNQVIEGNIIFGLEATNTTAAVTSQGIITTSATSGGVVSRNRIYGLRNYSGLSNADIFGIHFFLGQWSAFNNQITLDQENTSCRNVGIFDSSSTVARNTNYLYNTVVLLGNNDLAASTNSYCFLRSNSATTVYLRNNIFYNGKAGGSGFHYAIGNNVAAPSTGWGVQASEFNFYVSAVADRMGEWGTANYNFSQWKTNSNCDFISMNFLSSEISSSSIFNNTLTGDLNILASNSNSWFLKGGASQLTSPSVNNDYSGDSRSTTIAGGSTDLGSDEFTPSVPPPAMNIPVSVGPNLISIGGKPLGIINVVNNGGGSFTSINIQHFPGTNIPDPPSGRLYGNGYMIITSNLGAAGFQYDITFNYINEILGTISEEGKIRLAKSEDGINWIPYLLPGTNPGEYNLDQVNNTITVFGLNTFSYFALTDADAPLPVELASFTASIDRRDVHLNWTTASEMNNSGFNVERKTEGSETWSELGFVSGNGTTSEAKNYSFSDRGLNSGMYNYRLKQVDYNGNFEYFNLSSEVNVGVPDKYDLSQNYPNPFNPTTKINFDLPFDSKVTMKIFDITGREIATLVNEVQTAGYYTVTFDARSIASGTYFYRIIAEGGSQQFVMTKKLVVVK